MRIAAILLTSAALLLASTSLLLAETRCGWLANPTPGNWWLTDRDGIWVIAEQGYFEARGMDLMDDISTGDYIATNGNYGYACACMDVTTDNNSRVARLHSFRQLKMSKCTRDSGLPPPPD
jgi:hypothetical protein